MSERADSTQLSATYVVTADDLLVTNRFAERGALPMLYIAAAMGIPIGVLLIGWNPIVGALAIGLCIGVAILPMVPGFWRWWLTRQAGDLLGERRHFVFDAEGFHEERAGSMHTTPWSLLTHMRVTRDGVFLLHDRHVVLAVPARAFSSPDDVDRHRPGQRQRLTDQDRLISAPAVRVNASGDGSIGIVRLAGEHE